MAAYAVPASLTLIAYDKIKRFIMHDPLKTGYWMSISHLAQIMDMSRTPIREAVQMLVQDGLVEIHNGIGFFIRGLTICEVREITAVQKVLECQAVCCLSDNVSGGDIDGAMEQWCYLQQCCRAQQPVNLKIVQALSIKTHRLLRDNCQNGILRETLERIALRSARIQCMSIAADNVEQVIERYIAILTAITNKKIQQAVRLLKQHIERSACYIIDHPQLLTSDNTTQPFPQDAIEQLMTVFPRHQDLST